MSQMFPEITNQIMSQHEIHLCRKLIEGEPKLLLPLAYTLGDAAQVTGLSKRTIRRLVQRGLLRPSRASQRFIFSRTEIERFLKETTSE